MDDDRGRESELRCSCVKAMRGVLQCWMRQAALLEKYKHSHSEHDALHSRFNWLTGDTTISTYEYHHHQIDIVALFLLTLVQMITGGLQVARRLTSRAR